MCGPARRTTVRRTAARTPRAGARLAVARLACSERITKYHILTESYEADVYGDKGRSAASMKLLIPALEISSATTPASTPLIATLGGHSQLRAMLDTPQLALVAESPRMSGRF
eukprot:6209653-Pleurochrysis_carterae.AAC.6